MKCAVAIFAKTIGLSEIKTRLATDIGKQKAEEFYALSVKAIEELMINVSEVYGVSPHWAVGEKEAPTLAQWQAFPAIWTGDGGLGERLATLSERLFEDYDSVMFIGTDSPQLTPQVFGEASHYLKSNPNECVVGPADDGGFYLFASTKPVKRAIWEAVTYSKETTLYELKERSGKLFHDLKPEQDVDWVMDLVLLRDKLEMNTKDLLPAQLALLNWLKITSYSRAED